MLLQVQVIKRQPLHLLTVLRMDKSLFSVMRMMSGSYLLVQNSILV